MPKYIYVLSYTSGTWARLMHVVDDRVRAFRELAQSLGGSLDGAYWETSARAAYAIADMPDSTSAAAIAAVIAHTGAFKDVEVHEVFTQDQFTSMLRLADNVSSTYHVPGATALARDSSDAWTEGEPGR